MNPRRGRRPPTGGSSVLLLLLWHCWLWPAGADNASQAYYTALINVTVLSPERGGPTLLRIDRGRYGQDSPKVEVKGLLVAPVPINGGNGLGGGGEELARGPCHCWGSPLLLSGVPDAAGGPHCTCQGSLMLSGVPIALARGPRCCSGSQLHLPGSLMLLGVPDAAWGSPLLLPGVPTPCHSIRSRFCPPRPLLARRRGSWPLSELCRLS